MSHFIWTCDFYMMRDGTRCTNSVKHEFTTTDEFEIPHLPAGWTRYVTSGGPARQMGYVHCPEHQMLHYTRPDTMQIEVPTAAIDAALRNAKTPFRNSRRV